MHWTSSATPDLVVAGGARALHASVTDHAMNRYEVMDLADRSTVVDLVEELMANPRRRWTRADAELVLQVLAELPGYAVHIPWRSVR